MPFFSIGGGEMVLADNICTIITCLYSPQERLTKVPPVMSMFWAFAKRPEPET